jgi:hypothetical protein
MSKYDRATLRKNHTEYVWQDFSVGSSSEASILRDGKWNPNLKRGIGNTENIEDVKLSLQTSNNVNHLFLVMAGVGCIDIVLKIHTLP